MVEEDRVIYTWIHTTHYSLLHLQPLVTNFFGQRAYSVAYVITQMLRVQSLVAIQGCKNQEKP